MFYDQLYLTSKLIDTLFIKNCKQNLNKICCIFSCDVEFCGYTVPHPAEAKMHFRIQAKSGRAVDILRRGLKELEKVCEHVESTFENSMEEFKNSKVMVTS